MKKIIQITLVVLIALGFTLPLEAASSKRSKKQKTTQVTKAKKEKKAKVTKRSKGKKEKKVAKRSPKIHKDFAPYSSRQMYTRLWKGMRTKNSPEDVAQIKLLQIGLNKLGAGIKITGTFDQPTQKALKVVQDTNHIPADGYWFGKKTAPIINAALNQSTDKRLFVRAIKNVKNKATDVGDRFHFHRESNPIPTFYNDFESHNDVDTLAHRSTTGITLTYGSKSTMRICAVDPEDYRLGDSADVTYSPMKKIKKGRRIAYVPTRDSHGRIIYVTEQFLFADVGGGVFGKRRIDFYSSTPIIPVKIRIIPYTGVEPLLDKPVLLRRQFAMKDNWRGGTYSPPTIVSNNIQILSKRSR